MPDSILMPSSAEYFRVLPEIILTLIATLIVFLEAILTDAQKKIYGALSIVGLLGVAARGGTGRPTPTLATRSTIC